MRPGSASAGSTSSSFSRSRSLADVATLRGLEGVEVLSIRPYLRLRQALRVFQAALDVDEDIHFVGSQVVQHLLIFRGERRLDREALPLEPRDIRLTFAHAA